MPSARSSFSIREEAGRATFFRSTRCQIETDARSTPTSPVSPASSVTPTRWSAASRRLSRHRQFLGRQRPDRHDAGDGNRPRARARPARHHRHAQRRADYRRRRDYRRPLPARTLDSVATFSAAQSLREALVELRAKLRRGRASRCATAHRRAEAAIAQREPRANREREPNRSSSDCAPKPRRWQAEVERMRAELEAARAAASRAARRARERARATGERVRTRRAGSAPRATQDASALERELEATREEIARRRSAAALGRQRARCRPARDARRRCRPNAKPRRRGWECSIKTASAPDRRAKRCSPRSRR